MARHFSDWLKAYMEYTSASEAPTNFHFWTGVATIAGALRRRVWIDMKAFKWSPNFYIILVGPAGVATKSTTIHLGMKLLEQVKGIHFGPSSATWQALTKSLMGSLEQVHIAEPDGTERKLEMSCITIPASELGTFLKIEAEGFMDVLTDLWDGRESHRPWVHSTATQGEITIQNPWLNIIGATTPAWLREKFPLHLIGGGFTSRVIFVYGETKRQLVAYPSRQWKRSDYEILEQKLVEDLTEISQLLGEYKLTEEAFLWGESWYKNLWNGERPRHLASERYDAYLSRKQTHMHKIALVLSAARGNSLEITKEHLEVANQLLESTEPSMIKVYDSIGAVDQERRVREISQFLSAYGGTLPLTELYRQVKRIMSYEDFQKAVSGGIEGGDFRAIMLKMENGTIVKALRLSTPEDRLGAPAGFAGQIEGT